MIRKILVVENDQILRMALQKRLAACRDSFSVITAADGFEATKELEKFPFSLLVTEMIMPRMDGMSLIAHVREHYPDLPIIVASTALAPEIEEKLKAGSVLSCLKKPIRADELITPIKGSLRREADGGIIYDVSPTVFLQLMEMDAKTCSILVLDKASGKGGIVHFVDGRLVDAWVGGRRGIDAACEVFTWEVVTLFIHNGCSPRKNTINSDLQPIIMKAASMRDEAVGPARGGGDDEEENPVISRVKAILLKAGGTDSLTGFAYDDKMSEAAEFLQQIGAAAGFGACLAGALSGPKIDKIFLARKPAPVFTVKADSVQTLMLEKIALGSSL